MSDDRKKLSQVDVLTIDKETKVEVVNLTQSEDQRIQRLNRYAEKVEKQIEEISKQTSDDNFQYISEDEVRWYLEHVPDMIADAGLLLSKIERAYGYAKIDTKVIYAETWQKANRLRDKLGLTSAEDRKNYVQTNSEYLRAAKQELEWKYQLQRMQIIYDKYENIFTGVRKIATLLEKDNENVYRREKYSHN